MDAGGLENYIMNLYRQMDRSKIQFDFLVHYGKRCFFDQEIIQMGGRIFRLTVREDHNLLKYCRQLNRFFQEHKEYRIVHGHMSSLAIIYLGYAKAHGVPVRIIHSHNSNFSKDMKGYLKYLLSRASESNSTVRYACSTEAGNYLFNQRSFEIIPNGVDGERFHYDWIAREQVRKGLGLNDAFVVGHVGRFSTQKNHAFLLKLFAAYVRRNPRARLMLVGTGELEDQIHRLARELSVEEKILYTGVRRDTERMYQAMDVFVLPSLYEGLPVTGIEAQYAGLNCLFSDRISREVHITEQACFLPIGDENVGLWADALDRHAQEDHMNRAKRELLTDSFDIGVAAKAMASRYQAMWECKP